MNKTIFVTGSAGFIGSNLVLKLLKENEDIHIIGIDNMNDYYDVSIKEYRLNKIKEEVKKTTNKWSFLFILVNGAAHYSERFCSRAGL